MRFQQRLIKFAEKYQSIAYSILPFKRVVRPVFIIGCGRSGTTIFGRALSWHSDITYLNEPRQLWFSAYPETDIWTSEAFKRKGKLALSAADTSCLKSKKLKRLFHFELKSTGAPVLIEKLPINNFRLEFIYKIFPDARFIHIYRNGLEVAKSIEKMCETGNWFGENSYKWKLLVDYANSRSRKEDLPSLCETNYDKGLLEWRLSTEAAVDFLQKLPDEAFFEFKYDELIENPVETISRILEFIGVTNDQDVIKFASGSVARRTSKLEKYKLSDKEKMLGGELLPLSMDDEKGLSWRSS